MSGEAPSALLVLLLLGTTAVWRLYERSWLSPGVLLGLLWVAILGLDVVVVRYALPVEGLTFLVLSVSLFGLGALFASPGTDTRAPLPVPGPPPLDHRTTDTMRLGARRYSRLAIVFGALGMLEPLDLLRTAGYSPSSILKLQNLLSLASGYTHDRYAVAGYREPAIATLGAAFIFAAALFGGSSFAMRFDDGRAHDTWAWRARSAGSFLVFVPSVLATLFLTTRTVFVLTAILWISSYMAMSVLVRARGQGRERKSRHVMRAARVLVAVAAVVGITATAFVIRDGIAGVGRSEVDSELASSLLGAPSAFAESFPEQGSKLWSSQGLGTRTLYGPVGLVFHVPKPYFPSIPIGVGTDLQDETTNRTVFGDLIHDYSAPGALLLLFVGGYGAEVAFRKTKGGSGWALASLAGANAAILASVAMFPFTFTTVEVGWLLFAACSARTFVTPKRHHTARASVAGTTAPRGRRLEPIDMGS